MGQHGTGLCGNTLISGGSFDRVGYGFLLAVQDGAIGFSIRDTRLVKRVACIADVRDGMGVCHVLIENRLQASYRATLSFHAVPHSY